MLEITQEGNHKQTRKLEYYKQAYVKSLQVTIQTEGCEILLFTMLFSLLGSWKHKC